MPPTWCATPPARCWWCGSGRISGVRNGCVGRWGTRVSMAVDGSAVAAWGIAAWARAGFIARPFRLPEAIWAVAGAVLLVALGLLPWADAWSGVRKGLDVYCFLAGMMLIAEVARQEGVFHWLSGLAVARARGSPQRLFALGFAGGPRGTG